MDIKVAKFGGTSLADAGQFRKVQSIIESDEHRRYVIPSAPGKRYKEDTKVTDLLYLCHTQLQHKVSFDDTFHKICDRYLEIVKDLDLSLDLMPYLIDIKNTIEKGASLDYIASRGEYLNGIILSNLLGYVFIDAKEVIFFDKDHTLNLELTEKKMQEYLSSIERAVIPGFYGALPNGEVKIFSRGGSDITGALVARAVNACVYENWTDVSGLLMTDPNIVRDPKPIQEITYRELRELSYMGASVLHEETIFPVLDAGIPINIRNTNAPECPGTMIVSYADPITHIGEITGIAGKKDFTVIALEKNRMNAEVGFVRKLLTVFENNNISFEHLPSGIDTVSVVVTDCQLENKLDKLLNEIQQQCDPDLIEVYPNMALIATVGHGMAYTPGISAKLFTALSNEGINVRMIDQGSSEINIIVGVENDDFEKSVEAIYHAFV
ncbi:aspartate kinase [Clostridium formicaceticum]|uniref:Aspartokinase n=1 Tax=Clostridium formicaceticum TaxID=1497 RepID=A0AAC9WFA5_9CLOT|nr:aspartate kinase [Clostridium formicaceticum]AOY76149.1 aspartate kinase [Clostridium formicaceticum]ARE86518.1 Aspartokinase 3 [Clostridium formicaceticum]